MPNERRVPFVLFVDDDEMNLKTFMRAFRRELEIRTASSAEAGLAELESGQVALVISDYMMPGTDGIEFLRLVRARFPRVGRVLISGHVDLAELQNAKQQGLAAEVLSKPWDRSEILSLVASLMKGVQAQVTEAAIP
jgi:CheY-like chemotaxis protein